MPTAETLRAIARATDRSHGVTTRRALDLTQRQIDRCVAAGVLRRPHLGVYVNNSHPRSALQDLAIAVAAGGHLAAAWGRSALGLWELGALPATPEIVVPTRRWARIDGVLIHRSSDLCWEHVLTRQGIRVTNPLVTVLDLGVVLDPIDIAEVIVNARSRGLFEPSAVGATISRLARPGRTGVRAVRSALDLAMIGDRPAESVLEMRFALLAEEFDLPPYVYQHEVRCGLTRYFVDFAYPEVKLAIEVDGHESHATPAALERDTSRQNHLVLDGWTVLRFSWHRVRRDRAAVAAEILAALRSLNDQSGR